ncbi:zinc-dependent metalloprotease [Crocinitomix catalasitica]|uniref:zinc-dependent metalloprotease n=1 Tax=Crocinitomix catalasitica TaxID=184607 RepID=UPI000480C1DC|nr:zinc-dependent metalloprotease [Crocinitomix catalasitica]
MKYFNILMILNMIIFFSTKANGQGAIMGLNDLEISASYPSCGSFNFMQNIQTETADLVDLSDEFMEKITRLVQIHKDDREYADLLVIPVVFHVVYNGEDENLPDSIIYNQIEILNECFRRTNADASETRSEFIELVGDTKIEFRLAEVDPFGAATNGITRTATDVENFGGILPYGPGESDEIATWVGDSLYYNLFRLTELSLGGSDAWDTEVYLNIWSGDLRIFEPEFGDIEELVYFALATPPLDHENWPEELLTELAEFEQGVLIHYVNVGSNNQNRLPAPYAAYNGIVTTGKILVHEVGHYLGLRHIWGDGDCTADDFILDTPNSNNSSNWTCSHAANSCIDDIGGTDLKNMVENYMDYSRGNCQNSFTIGQADVMRTVLEINRPFLAETISTANIDNLSKFDHLNIYPNPFKTEIHIENASNYSNFKIFDLSSKIVISGELNSTRINVSDLATGTYIIEVANENSILRTKIVKE